MKIRFRIDETFADIEGDFLDVYTGNGDGDCGIRVDEGKQYLIDGNKDEHGKIKVSICSRTRSIESAAALLPQLRAMRDHQKVASLFGLIIREDQNLDETKESQPSTFANIVVRLRANEKVFETVTDSTGAYSFRDLPPGSYTFEPTLPQGWGTGDRNASAESPPHGDLPENSCYEQNVYVYPSGSVAGKVIDEKGRGVGHASVELIPASRGVDDKFAGSWESSKEDGTFELAQVAPGDYLLVFNRGGRIDPDTPYATTYFPGTSQVDSATTIHLQPGQRFANADIRLSGGMGVREYTVRVQWSNGKPAAEVLLSAKSSNPEYESANRELAAGLWSIKLLKGVEYTLQGKVVCQIWGETWGGPGKEFQTDAIVIPPDSTSGPEFKLVLNGDRCPPGNVGGPPPWENVQPH